MVRGRGRKTKKFIQYYGSERYELITRPRAKKPYSKNWGHANYVITDQIVYNRYWVGKRPSNRRCFEDWLMDPDASMFETSKRHGKQSWSIQLQVTAMKKLGILTKHKMGADS